MHKSSMIRMKWFKDTYLHNYNKNETLKVLDVGSKRVSDQSDTYKILFNEPPFKYTGLDVIEGDNVDIAVNHAYQWNEVSNDFYDVVISGQIFSHVELPWITISEMARVLKPDKMLCILTPSSNGLCRYPVTCQNYFADGLIALAKYAGLQIIHASTNLAPPKASSGWYNLILQDNMLIAKKPADWKPDSFDRLNYFCEPADLEKMAGGLIPMRKQPLFTLIRQMTMKTIVKGFIPYGLLMLYRIFKQ